ncbi:uncharacterized protein L969DRAFT_95025 [Mixia osmundae IAM 14324]|uniref:Uncharacterized protein n=1 Tax=Mixia osmundae (strain CBS 9802 / IAM 14324 / JCM 22182 / KY 12970) TaxID=764103 RepID=G7E100_MIXOS|nr:uncharacterized protein L969DRAFT_95025 [Mixia osmundae IAM 14324]KEI38855.1 hypothetical protein L969DRAFT_95025 [Mixia osmundae IAM 14324]GAA96510.1 hypothetical protein E5Q_03178 [Mixia osmundae IAM 14324]
MALSRKSRYKTANYNIKFTAGVSCNIRATAETVLVHAGVDGSFTARIRILKFDNSPISAYADERRPNDMQAMAKELVELPDAAYFPLLVNTTMTIDAGSALYSAAFSRCCKINWLLTSAVYFIPRQVQMLEARPEFDFRAGKGVPLCEHLYSATIWHCEVIEEQVTFQWMSRKVADM